MLHEEQKVDLQVVLTLVYFLELPLSVLVEHE